MTCLTTYPVERIQTAVCRVARCTMDDIRGVKRNPSHIAARWLFVAAIHTYTNHSWPEIARMMGRRFHSTPHTAWKRWKKHPKPSLLRAVEDECKSARKHVTCKRIDAMVMRRLYRMWWRDKCRVNTRLHRVLVRLMQDQHNGVEPVGDLEWTARRMVFERKRSTSC